MVARRGRVRASAAPRRRGGSLLRHAGAASRRAGARERCEVQRAIAAPHAEPQLVVPRRLSGAVARVRVHPARPEHRVCRRIERHGQPRWCRFTPEGEPMDALSRAVRRAGVADQRRDVPAQRLLRGTAAPLRRGIEAVPCVRAEQDLQLRALRRAHLRRGRHVGVPRAVAGGDGAERERGRRKRAAGHRPTGCGVLGERSTEHASAQRDLRVGRATRSHRRHGSTCPA